MLVLTRRTNESIVVNEEITVTILAIEGEKVKIGINAPREISIYRQELWQAICEQNKIVESLSERPEPAGFKELRNFLEEETKREQTIEVETK